MPLWLSIRLHKEISSRAWRVFRFARCHLLRPIIADAPPQHWLRISPESEPFRLIICIWDDITDHFDSSAISEHLRHKLLYGQQLATHSKADSQLLLILVVVIYAKARLQQLSFISMRRHILYLRETVSFISAAATSFPIHAWVILHYVATPIWAPTIITPRLKSSRWLRASCTQYMPIKI